MKIPDYQPDIAKLKKWDKKEFKKVYLEYYPIILRFVRSYIKEYEESENIVQDTFLILWEKSADLEDNTNIQAYLFIIAKNKALNLLEKLTYRTKSSENLKKKVDRDLLFKINTLSAFEPHDIFTDELNIILQKAMDKLPPQTRMIFELSRFEGLKNKEIAEKLELSEKSIEFHITKSLKLLREELSEYLSLIIFLISI